MSLPTSRNRTYAAGQMVQSGDLNDIQDGIANDTNGTVSKAAVVVDGVGGATVAARAADGPLRVLKDKGGNVRGLDDHLGYPLSMDILDMREDWIGTSGAIAVTTSPMTGFQRWSVNIASTGNTASATGGGVNGYASPSVQVNLGNTNTSSVSLGLLCSPLLQTFHSLVFEVDIVNPSLGGTWSIQVGVNVGGALANQAIFSASNAATNWQCLTRDNSSASSTPVDSGVAVSLITGSQRLRIELHGSASPYGAVSRFFINGSTTPVATVSTNQPAVGHIVSPGFYILSGDTTASRMVNVGAARFLLNRALSAASI